VTDPARRYELRLSSAARRALSDRLAAAVAFAAWEFCDGVLREHPRRVGHPLVSPFEGCWAARRGTYRIRYEIDEASRVVTVLDIAGRAGGRVFGVRAS
jgi:mRNA interferase RelE/StbE